MQFFLQKDIADVLARIKGRAVRVAFNGVTRIGEVFVLVVRWTEDNACWSTHHRLLAFKMAGRSMDGTPLGSFIRYILEERFLMSRSVASFMRDGVAMNGTAVNHLKLLYTEAKNLTWV